VSGDAKGEGVIGGTKTEGDGERSQGDGVEIAERLSVEGDGERSQGDGVEIAERLSLEGDGEKGGVGDGDDSLEGSVSLLRGDGERLGRTGDGDDSLEGSVSLLKGDGERLGRVGDGDDSLEGRVSLEWTVSLLKGEGEEMFVKVVFVIFKCDEKKRCEDCIQIKICCI
jgi:hypothetical protein